MILITEGDIFKSSAEMIVNPVNCVGIMGKGLAKEFKKKYPDMFDNYSLYCKSNRLFMGNLFTYKCHQTKKPNYIVCLPTKIRWQDKSRYIFINQGLYALKKEIKKLNVKSVALPALGCGLGELDFIEVTKLITYNLSNLKDVKIYVFKPY